MAKIKEGFKGERLVSLPEELLASYQREPLIDNLYVCEIDFLPRVKYHLPQEGHGYDHTMLIYCTEGKGRYRILGKQCTTGKCQYIIIPPGISCSFGAGEEDPWTIYWLHSQDELRDQFLPLHPVPVTILPNEYSRLRDRLQLFEKIYSNFSVGYIKEYTICSFMCPYNFLASSIYLEQLRHIMTPSQKGYPLTAWVIHYMHESIQQNLVSKGLASYFKYSPSHFSVLLFGKTEVSPVNYFIRLKIRRTCEYIEPTDMKLNEITTHLGLENTIYFSHTFTRAIGCPPSTYRKKEMEI